MPRVSRPPARPSRLKILVRRQRRNLRFVLFGACGFAVVLVCVTLLHSAGGREAGIVTWQEKLGRAIDLRVQRVEIAGRQNMPEAVLRNVLGVHEGSPLFGFSVEAARARIEAEPWVAHVAVERRLPGTIFVDLTERRPFAIWQNQKKFQLIDRDGQVVTDEDVASFQDLPVVVGAGAPAHAAALLALLDAAPDLKSRVSAAVRVGERRWDLDLKNGITVMLPEQHEEAAIARLQTLERDQQLLDRPLVFVDLRLADRLALRAKTPASPADAAPAPLAAPPGPNRRAT